MTCGKIAKLFNCDKANVKKLIKKYENNNENIEDTRKNNPGRSQKMKKDEITDMVKMIEKNMIITIPKLAEAMRVRENTIKARLHETKFKKGKTDIKIFGLDKRGNL